LQFSGNAFATNVSKRSIDSSNSPAVKIEFSGTPEISKTDKPDAEITVKNSNLQDVTPISGFTTKSAIASVQASLPDLSLTLLRTSASQPLPNAVAVTFEVTLSNLGTTPAVNPILSLYEDNTLQSMVQITGTLNAGNQGVFTYGVTSHSGGSHTLKVVANESHTISESNYSNNTAEGVFVWKDCISLVAEHLGTNDGGTEYESNYQQKFIYEITNHGNLSAQNVPYSLYLNGSLLLQSSNTIPARTTLIGSFFMTIKKAGNYQLSLKVDPNKTINDIDTSDNSINLNLGISYDTELWAGKWEDASDLDVEVHSSAVQIMTYNSNVISTDQAASAVRAWNNINPNVFFNTIHFDSPDNTDEVDQTTMPIHIYGVYTLPNDAIGITTVFKASSDGAVGIPEEDLFTDDSTYVRGQVVLSEYQLMNLSTTSQKKTVTHEIGHVLGLAHPACGDVALMRQTVDPLVAFTIQPHDKYNLNQQY